MNFVDFDYYKNSFLGTLIPISDFYHIERKSVVYVDYMLMGKKTDSDVIKDAVCAACEVIYTELKRNGIKSENTDGYSVTFFDNDDIKDKVFNAVSIYLANTGLLYRGIY